MFLRRVDGVITANQRRLKFVLKVLFEVNPAWKCKSY